MVVVGCGDDASNVTDSDADVGFVPCGGEQCSVSEYCQRPIGFCGTSGNCENKPTECVSERNPVCGCDGNSYANTCVAARNNVSVEKLDLCNEDDEPITD